MAFLHRRNRCRGGPSCAGIGATLALPFLDAMVPALSLRGRGRGKPAHRFQTFYVPNGMAMEYWTPKGEGSGFELSPILEPLAPFRNQMLVLSGLKANWNYIHAGASGSFLTGTTARRTQRGRDHRRRLDGSAAGAAVRQGDAGRLARAAMDAPANAGACTGNLSCAYTHTHLLAERDAAAADGVQPARGVREAVRRQRQHRARGARSAAAAAQEHSRLGERQARRPQARARAAGSGARSTSTPSRFATSSGASRRPRSSATSSCRCIDQPQGVPPVFEDHLALMLDLQLLALAVGSDARHLVHDQQGAERAAVSADRRARGAPSAVAPRQRCPS